MRSKVCRKTYIDIKTMAHWLGINFNRLRRAISGGHVMPPSHQFPLRLFYKKSDFPKVKRQWLKRAKQLEPRTKLPDDIACVQCQIRHREPNRHSCEHCLAMRSRLGNKRIAEGICVNCNNKAINGLRCDRCAAKNRENCKKWYKNKVK